MASPTKPNICTLQPNVSNGEKKSWSSSLEVEKLDAVGKDEEEEQNPANMGNHNRDKKIMIIAQVVFKEIIHPHLCKGSGELDFGFQVA